MATMLKEQMKTIGEEMYGFISALYPICRSITGDGVRQTLEIIKGHIPINTIEVPSGTRVFDWSVPKEWNIRDAYIKNTKGERLIDFRRSNLHVVSYSMPVRTRMPLSELRDHCITLKEHPKWIPYRTSYYREWWGFCLAQNELDALREDEDYDVCIDSSLEDGSLTYGEYFIQGRTPDEILLSCHVCHPSLCNDNLSGIALATFLAKSLASKPRRYSYRILFTPGLIGSITWLSRNEHQVDRIKHGLILACAGDPGNVTYKRSRQGNAMIDRAAAYVLRHSGQDHRILEFSPYGYDERQFCSPGFNLPVGCFMRTPHGEFSEYHTSADDLTMIQPESLGDSFKHCMAILNVLEANATYLNQNPKCEPQLGRRGLYGAIGGGQQGKQQELALLWVLNQSDGTKTLLDIAERSDVDFEIIRWAAENLLDHGLLKEVEP
jgi:aminopeptidase-like protein